ncbi:MAG: phospholipid/cholesterol/gamma-HCH transport system substrate-binding protein [Mycobacterium sp.]|jgi:phospholipid/cholesterol/gamma-HCH transport system substrate-binding protein|nr:phospholipid/cholesterol/gamma-HCH transport system substrate-binding protein [Mycobacterium sp.]MDT5356023.1 phospholipid/cholesterol/gamma-HCH transport system substrate-binding protein [Mycobacterium sp.]
MRALQPHNGVRIGIMAVLLTLLATAVGQSFTSAPMLFAEPRYYGEFTDSGALRAGDKVRIAGMDVGTVQELKIATGHVVVRFTLGGNTIGAQSRLSIRTDTILGRKVLEIEPRGEQPLRAGATLPLDQTTTPYQIYDAFRDATKAAAGWDIDTVKQSLHVLSETVDQTYPHLSATLDGVQRFADTVAKRDERVQHLLGETSKVAGVLGIHGEQINRLLVNAQTLLAAINARGQAIDALLGNIQSVAAQVQGLINDNPNLNTVLKQVNAVSDVLVHRKDDLVTMVTELGKFVASLSEIVSSGPYVKAAIFNLLPYQILQPFVDAAFKKRGIDPENFWRSAGLPAFQWPDPNGTRLPNGAPPPAPPVLEGTPEHPGPAVPPGSPCSYTPPADGLPRPDNPLPCANLDVGPFGGPGYPAPIGIQTSAPNPSGLPPTPGIPAAGLPGAPPPDVPGTPVPLPPAPPGARTGPPAPGSPPLPQFPPAETGGNQP